MCTFSCTHVPTHTHTLTLEKNVTICHLESNIQVSLGPSARLASKFAGAKLAPLPSKVRKTLSTRKGASGLVRLAVYILTTCPPWLVLIWGATWGRTSRSQPQTQELLLQSMSISWGVSILEHLLWDPLPRLLWKALMSSSLVSS